MVKVRSCELCDLHKTRTKIVAGEGSLDAAVKFFGEAPGRDEDESGRPFIGRSGQLLRGTIIVIGGEDILSKVYISNVVLCRPPENRDPTYDELKSCSRHWRYDILSPKTVIVCCVGKVAATTIIGSDFEWNTVYRKHRRMCIPIYHPSFILRKGVESEYGKKFKSGILRALRKGGLI